MSLVESVAKENSELIKKLSRVNTTCSKVHEIALSYVSARSHDEENRLRVKPLVSRLDFDFNVITMNERNDRMGGSGVNSLRIHELERSEF